MKNHFKKIGAFLRKTWVWTLLVVLFSALLVWFVGPLLAVDDYKFWEAATARLLTISVLFLTWGLTMVYVSWRSGVRKKAVEDSADGKARIEREEKMQGGQKELKVRFQDALRTLKTSSVYRGRSERWRSDQQARPQAYPRYPRHPALRLVFRRAWCADRRRRPLLYPAGIRSRRERVEYPAGFAAQTPTQPSA
jgi:hypothetical protein